MTAFLLCLTFSGVGVAAYRFTPEMTLTRADYDLATTIRKEFPAETVIWTWWDYGYFYRFLTGMRPLFDGGSQTDLTCFTAAYPLMQGDLDWAAAWMRQFAVTSPSSLALEKRGSGWQQYTGNLAEGFAKKHAGETQSVALCLPARVYTTVGFLYSFAHIYDAEVPPVVNRLELFTKDGFSYSPGTGNLFVPEAMVTRGYEGFGSVVDASGKTPGQFDFAAMADPYLVHSDDTDFLAITDQAVIGSVLFRLLGMFHYSHKHFDPVYFDYRHGGVWRVR